MKQGIEKGIWAATITLALIAVVYAGGRYWLPHMGGMGRHHQGMFGVMPSAYSGLHNPLAPNQENLHQGKQIYRTNCLSCHGERGEGNGPAATGLNPPPANLSWLMRMPMAADDYLFWRISEGGQKQNTAMPPFGHLLSNKERWQLIHYLRQL
jgi:mono/diheme cytochrome c family protein